MNFDFYHNYMLQSYCCNLHYILAYLLFSVSNKPLPLPSLMCFATNSKFNVITAHMYNC